MPKQGLAVSGASRRAHRADACGGTYKPELCDSRSWLALLISHSVTTLKEGRSPAGSRRSAAAA